MKIYVFSPQGFTTGGIELLHQLCSELNSYEDIDACIWYHYHNGAGIPDVYKKYGNKFKVTSAPPKDAILIFPESWAFLLNSAQYKDYIKVIYFESVYYYEKYIPKDQYMVFPENTIFMSQSWYAYKFLQGSNIDSIFVTDYLNDEYMNTNLNKPRKRQILYNPAKGINITTQIMSRLPEEKFIAIENMTTLEVKELMEESMLYIDFGNHPGKDRIPREAAMCGCCVITNKQGSAFYYQDVSIPDEYKFDDNQLDEAITKITHVLDNYDLCKEDFELYRKMIRNEKQGFKIGVIELIDKLKEIKGE